jgi:hypothetical protein
MTKILGEIKYGNGEMMRFHKYAFFCVIIFSMISCTDVLENKQSDVLLPWNVEVNKELSGSSLFLKNEYSDLIIGKEFDAIETEMIDGLNGSRVNISCESESCESLLILFDDYKAYFDQNGSYIDPVKKVEEATEDARITALVFSGKAETCPNFIPASQLIEQWENGSFYMDSSLVDSTYTLELFGEFKVDSFFFVVNSFPWRSEGSIELALRYVVLHSDVWQNAKNWIDGDIFLDSPEKVLIEAMPSEQLDRSSEASNELKSIINEYCVVD